MPYRITTSSIDAYNEFIAAGGSPEDATFLGRLDPAVEGQPRTGRSFESAAELNQWFNEQGVTGDMIDTNFNGIDDREEVTVSPARVAPPMTAAEAQALLDDPTWAGNLPLSGSGYEGDEGEPTGPGDGSIAPGARNVIESTLRRWGFSANEISGLSGWVQQQLQAGVGIESILILIYDQPNFQARFPGMEAARTAGYTPPSPDEYIEYEDSLREYIDQYLPNEAAGDLDVLMTNLLGGNISIQQVRDRLQIAYDQILNAPVDVKSWFLQEYGESADAMLATVLLDPDQNFTDLEQAAKESYTQAAANEILNNVINKDTASKIARLGYTQESQYRQFTDLARQEFLYLERLTETDDLQIQSEGVEAAFGTDVDSMRKVERREEERLSEFAGGGGAFAGTGLTGFGAINA